MNQMCMAYPHSHSLATSSDLVPRLPTMPFHILTEVRFLSLSSFLLFSKCYCLLKSLKSQKALYRYTVELEATNRNIMALNFLCSIHSFVA